MIDDSYFLNYTRFIANIDTLTEKITGRYKDEIHCTRGCVNCCIPGIKISPLEAFHISRNIDREAIAINSDGSGCIFLAENTFCSIYPYRPLLCRTQGYPLLYKNSNEGISGNGPKKNSQYELSCCDFNFSGQTSLEGDFIIDMERVNLILGTLNIQFLRDIGRFDELKNFRFGLKEILDL